MNTPHDYVAHSALRSIRQFADVALEPAPPPAHPPPSFLGLSPTEIREYSIGRALQTLVTNRGWGAVDSLERHCNERLQKRLGATKNLMAFFVPYEVQHRALVVGTAANGGYLVETVNMGFIDALRKRTLAYRLGAVPMPGLVGNLNLPRLSSGATPTVLSTESSAITEQDDSFGQIALSPHNFGAFTQVSRQLLLQSAPAIDLVVSNDLTRSAATTIDNMFFNGLGSAGQPTGVFSTAGIGSTSGTSFSWNSALSMIDTMLSANVAGDRLAFVTTPGIAHLLANRQRFSGSNSSVWEGSLRDGSISGIPAASSTVIPTNSIALIDFSQTVIAQWADLQIMADPFSNFQSAVVGIRALFSVDVGVMHLPAINYATGVT